MEYEADAHAASLSVAAIASDTLGAADALLADVAQQQRRAGRRVRGLLMTYPDGPVDGSGGQDCAASMVLVDITTAEPFLVSQPLGKDSKACRADPQGFARASVVLRRALDERPDLVISNRFGSLESEGGGFTDELLALMAEGIPVLTAVGPKHREAWARFTGGAPVLPATPEAVAGWLHRHLKPLPAA